MKFSIKKRGDNLVSLGRRIGYIPQRSTEFDEVSFVRPIARDYPRFHLYVREVGDDFLFNLHLDQRKPSYGGETAHSGEYEGETVQSEAIRIQQMLA